MKVLVACEFSGVVRDAFLAKGHDAMSCDLLPTESEGPHYQGDVRRVLGEGWDLVIAHPPCTDLSWANGGFLHAKRKDGRTAAAARFARLFLDSAPRVCIENPARGDLVYWLGRPTQIVDPWRFGDPYLKRTGLWLYGLCPLEPLINVVPEGVDRWVNPGSTYKAQYKTQHGVPISGKNGQAAAKTFRGIATAMADQWGNP